jgi:hypothetical protein
MYGHSSLPDLRHKAETPRRSFELDLDDWQIEAIGSEPD